MNSTIRIGLKSAASAALSFSGAARLAHATRFARLPLVIAYHRVVETLSADGTALPAMEITASMLARHLDWIATRFDIVSLDELESMLNVRRRRPLAAITFDDGYSDVFHHGFPLLRRKGIPATMFVVTDLVGTDELPLHERLYSSLAAAWRRWSTPDAELARLCGSSLRHAVNDPFAAARQILQQLSHSDVEAIVASLGDAVPPRSEELRPMTWPMLAAMRDAGMTIGSHSRTHAFLTNETAERVIDEVRGSRDAIRHHLGTAARTFAYPGGLFDSATVRAVKNAGYAFAFTTCTHRDAAEPLLTIPRTTLWERGAIGSSGRFSASIMSAHAAGAFEWRSSCATPH